MSTNQRSILKHPTLSRPRDVKKVPFVELYAGRLQGVVSSGSDIERVYVSYIEADTTNFYCSTNNNRPCGGLRGQPCKHLDALVKEAHLQFSETRIVNYLGLTISPEQVESHRDLMSAIKGGPHKVDASMVFSRFLRYLQYVNLPASVEPLPEMVWFT
ncbi:MAG: hypothetical protein AAF702_41300 [Chloroflexota bacterium]